MQQRIRPDSGAARTEYSEYWYDALGRRVLARESGDSTSGAGTITRFAWEGDQLLKEFRIVAGYAVGSLEGLGSGSWYGTRRYTQTGVIDQPLVLWLDDAAPRVVVRNWRGSAAGAMMVGGGGPDTLVYPAATVDVQYAPDALMGAVTPTAWLGSLIAEQADATGLLYRRNRYYDPQTGRFTQEDPIGLAGGMNLYGYANGDPINYSDPFGLCPPDDTDVSTCANDNVGNAWRALADAGTVGTTLIANVVAAGLTVNARKFSANDNCGTHSCIVGKNITLNSSESPGELAAAIGHEYAHSTESWPTSQTSAGENEARAWDATLDVANALRNPFRRQAHSAFRATFSVIQNPTARAAQVQVWGCAVMMRSGLPCGP